MFWYLKTLKHSARTVHTSFEPFEVNNDIGPCKDDIISCSFSRQTWSLNVESVPNSFLSGFFNSLFAWQCYFKYVYISVAFTCIFCYLRKRDAMATFKLVMLVPRPVVRCSHFPIVWAIIVRHWGNSLPHFYKKKLLVPLSFNQKWAAGSNCGRKIRAISQYSNREITFQLTKCMCVSRLRFTESTSRDSHKFLSWIRNICYKIQM